MKKLVIATRNQGKVNEMLRGLDGTSFEIVSLAQYPDFPDVDETGATFEENAVLKAVECSKYTGRICLADDSGLEVDALGGKPGVYSARYAPTDSERITRLLDEMSDVPDERRSARFRCVVAIAWPEGLVKTCAGAVEGFISREPLGDMGFGYDPIFHVTELDKRMAQLTADEKNAISHRGKALAEARLLLADYAG